MQEINEIILQGLAKEYSVQIQPQMDLKNKQLCGGELLLRKRRSNGSMYLPRNLIQQSEQSGMIKFFDLFVIRQACLFLTYCKEKNIPILPLSCNLSRSDFVDENYIEEVDSLIKSFDIEPSLMHLEITETAAIKNDLLNKSVNKIKDCGYPIAIDDFGTGYSNFASLCRGDYNYIKFDYEFLHNNNSEQDKETILKQFIGLAQYFNFKTICEGVETKEHQEFLRNAGCDILQGYIYSPPISLEEYQINFLETVREA